MDPAPLEPAVLLHAYAMGWFPMAIEENKVKFYGADPRAIFPIEEIMPSKKMRRILRDKKWQVSRNQYFDDILEACAQRDETWINEEIVQVYKELHRLGAAHSVDVRVEGELVGGLYGVALGGAFFGESMFNRIDDAAKVAFYHLVEHLRSAQFILLDSQFINSFTQRLGAVEIPSAEYKELLDRALLVDTMF